MKTTVDTNTLVMTKIGRIVVPPLVPDGAAVFYTTRDFEGRLDSAIASDLMEVLGQQFGVDATLATCSQVHGKTVVRAPQGDRWSECDSCDSLWTETNHLALGIKVADCLPVTILDASHSVIANIHSGWRGAVQDITEETIDAIAKETPFDASSAFAWLGPSIRVCCFEVGEEVVDQFRAAFAEADQFIDRSQTKPHIDIAALTASILLHRGFAQERIVDTGLCTRCDAGVDNLVSGSRGLGVSAGWSDSESGDSASQPRNPATALPGAQPRNPATAKPLFHSFRREPKRGGRNLAISAQ